MARFYHAVMDKNGVFIFKVPVSHKTGYFDIYAPRKKTYQNRDIEPIMPIITLQFYEAGDDILIEIDHKETFTDIYSQCVFSGKNATKYTARALLKNPGFVADIDRNNVLKELNNDNLTDTLKKCLKQFKLEMSKVAYEVLVADLSFLPKAQFLSGFVFDQKKARQDTIGSKIAEALMDIEHTQLSATSLRSSYNYLSYSFEKAKLLSIFDKELYNSIGKSIISNSKNGTTELLLVYYFQNNIKSKAPLNEYNAALPLIKDPELLRLFKQFKHKLPGTVWQNYVLKDEHNKPVKLSEFDDKVVLIDFWFTGCGYCANYYQKVLSKIKEESKGSNIAFLSISIDGHFDTWKQSVDSGKYTDSHSHNYYTGGLRNLHPIIKENGISTYPFVVLLNKNRVLQCFNTQTLYSLEGLRKELLNLL